MCEPDRANSEEPTARSYRDLFALLGESEDEANRGYELLRAKLISYFEGRKVTPADDYADEVLHRIAEKISNGENVEDINRYAFGIARFVRLESYRRQIHQPIDDDDPDSDPGGWIHPALIVKPNVELLDEDSQDDIMRDCLHSCLGELDVNKRELLLTYYECDESSGKHKEHRKKLAAKLKKSAGALQKQICLLRQKVSSCTKACVQKGNPNNRVRKTRLLSHSFGGT